MSFSNNSQVISEIKLNSIQKRLLLAAPAILLAVTTFFAVRWCFASSIAEFAQDRELVEYAAGLSPSDPHVKYALAAIREKEFLLEEITRAQTEYERATALSPHDFRFWLALGRMRERAGDSEGAENAVRRALELAPAYAQVRWTLGNILLRKGKSEEAFAELRRAAESNPDFAPHVVNAAFQQYGAQNVREIAAKLGESGAVRAALISFLAKEKRFDDAVGLWGGFSDAQKKEFKTGGEELFRLLMQEKRYRTMLKLYPQIYSEDADKPLFEKISNPGFESDIAVSGGGHNPFTWKIAEGQEPQIGFDNSIKHDGAQSLGMIFKSVSGNDFRQISQIVGVESNAAYRLEFFARSEGLKSSSTVRWEVLDETDGRVLASSPQVETDESDWQKITVDFTTAGTEAVQLRLARVVCTISPCSLVGKIWFDDFNLQKIDRK